MQGSWSQILVDAANVGMPMMNVYEARPFGMIPIYLACCAINVS